MGRGKTTLIGAFDISGCLKDEKSYFSLCYNAHFSNTSTIMLPTFLTQRSFLCFMITRLATIFAVQIQSIVVAWHLYDVTRDPMVLAYVGLAQFIPMLLTLPIAGDVVDRFNRKIVLACGLSLAAACSAGLLFFAQQPVPSLLPIYGCLMVFGVARSLANPALQSLLPQIVPRKKLAQAIATNSTIMKISTILGPVSGGFLYGFWHEKAYAACTVFFLLAIVPLIWVQLTNVAQTAVAAPFSPRAIWQRFREGGTFIWQQPIILGAISLDLFAVLLGGVVALLPIYANEVLHVGAEGLGLLRSAMAIGEIATGLYLTRFPITRSVGKTMFIAVALFGIANLVFALSTTFWLSFAALVCAGVFDMISVNIRGTLIQLSTPDAMRGRVSAVNMMFISSSNELGHFRAGTVARYFGEVPTAVMGSLFTLGVVGFMMAKFKPLRDVQTFEQATQGVEK